MSSVPVRVASAPDHLADLIGQVVDYDPTEGHVIHGGQKYDIDTLGIKVDFADEQRVRIVRATGAALYHKAAPYVGRAGLYRPADKTIHFEDGFSYPEDWFIYCMELP